MKCKFCGAKVGKTEEICPECGKYLLSQESSADMGECLKTIDCKDNIPVFAFTFILSIAAFAIAVNEIRKAGSPATESIIIIASGIFLCVMSVYMCVIYLKSYICVCENGIYGVVPLKGKPFPKYFELSYSEIEFADMRTVRSGKGGQSCIVSILTKTGCLFQIGCLSPKKGELLVDILRRMIK